MKTRNYGMVNSMISGVKAIIFDWGGVLIDAATKLQFPESESVLRGCREKGYRLTLACIASKFDERKTQIESSNLRQFFEMVAVGPMTVEQITDASFRGKDTLYGQIMNHLGLEPREVLIVDDRTIRGITYASAHGHPSVWVQNGKFAHELPSELTGQPTYTIHSVAELPALL